MLETCSPFVLLQGDALLTPFVVDLAASGALKDEALPMDARVELAARRSELLSAPEPQVETMDARHRLFARALYDPLSPLTLELGGRLASAAGHDALIAVAVARLTVARGSSLSPAELDRLLAVDPADPIVAAAVLDFAKRSGDAQAIAPARARLTALARTPGERARATE
jgi:hypothetical protein